VPRSRGDVSFREARKYKIPRLHSLHRSQMSQAFVSDAGSGFFLLRSQGFERSTSIVNLPFLELPQLLPQFLGWVEAQEKDALSHGAVLSQGAANDARAAGVNMPEKVRVRAVGQIPQPDHPRIKELAREFGLLTPSTAAITFGHGIFIQEDRLHDREILVHEFVHVAQYERLGIEDFLMQYVLQIFKNGYENAPMEREAREAAERVCRPVIGNQ
jgi:Domain of unknown function (DUF4157)